MDIKKAVNLLVDTIAGDKKHQDYDRVVAAAKQWKQIITGEDVGELIKRFSPRVDAELHAQQVLLTQVITPAVCNSLMTPFNKIPRARPIEDSITGSDGKPLEDVQKVVDNYFAGQSLDNYLENIYIPVVFWDPNSFIITTFDDFDHRFKKPKGYSVLVTCLQAVNYEFANGELQWLIVKSDPNDMGRFMLYTDTNVIEARRMNQDDPTTFTLEIKLLVGNMKDGEVFYQNNVPVFYRKDKQNIYSLTVNDPKTGEILALRTGSILDKWTDNRTCLSPLQPALNYLLKSIKVVSEMDISISLHVFLQKFVYVPRCYGNGTDGCNKGYTGSGHLCEVCKGTGKIPIHTNSADTVELPLPEDVIDLFDLSKMVHYQDLPMDIVEFLDKFIDKLERKCTKALYASEIFQTDTTVTTATEKVIDYESILDSLFPGGRQYAQVRIKITRLNGKFLGHNDIVVKFKLAYDLKIRNQGQLITDLKAANDSGASAEVREAISDDLTRLLYTDNPDEFKKLKIRDDFNPFSGKTTTEIMFVINANLCTIEQKVMWSQSPDIWNALEQANSNIYEMEISKIKGLLDAEVTRRSELLASQQIVAGPFPGDGGNAGQAGDSIGKLPLGAQQLGLALMRANEAGNTQLAAMIEGKMKEIIDAIEVE